MSLKERFAKYTKKSTGYEISLFAKGKRWNKLFVPSRVLQGILPLEKEQVLCTTYTDILGFQYIGSAKYTPANKQLQSIQLLN
jgi:hypothetical protein